MSLDNATPAPPAARLIVGTAGHIDHGKTALVRALTGVDCDRLPEEKERGITIALGFAPLELAADLHMSIVDVPGHESLVRTMVSGATGIDLVLLVVAADEGVMPQTREHVAICDLLGLSRCVVALSKIDTVSREVARLAEDEVLELLADTSLRDAPIVPVCALRGIGITELRAALVEAAKRADPRTSRAGPSRLGVDRAFAMKGFGTVVTGTLIGSALEVGHAVEILPARRRARIRGLQNHGAPAERIEPGSRCAVNLQGVELSDVRRGDLLAWPDAIEPTNTLDAQVRWLPGAPALGDEASVEFLSGTLSRRARISPLGPHALPPGAVGFARLWLEGALAPLLPGDRFVLRGFARLAHGGQTLGGGVALDVAPPRRRRADPDLLEGLLQLAKRDVLCDLRVRITRSGLSGIAGDRLRRELGLTPEALDPALALLAAKQEAVVTASGVWLAAEAIADLKTRIAVALSSLHAAEPLRPGAPRGALRGRLPENLGDGALDAALAQLGAAGLVSVEGDLVRLAAHRPTLRSGDETLAAQIAAEAAAAGLEPPSLKEWASRLGTSVERVRELAAHLARQGRIVRAPGDLFFDRAAIDTLRERVVAYLQQHGAIDTAAYKALIGTSRRTAVPLMELFDEERLTLRRGEERALRRGA
ncbi:MAG TPA: selenocysteine-specific translation elongation factor [Myxococcota bacterium]|nr:selenocysteine-specific translation elongation factor [Myxococcota bacterium]